MSDYKRKGERVYKEDSRIENSRKKFAKFEGSDWERNSDKHYNVSRTHAERDTRDRYGDRDGDGYRERSREDNRTEMQYTTSKKESKEKVGAAFATSAPVTTERWGKEIDNVSSDVEKAEEEVVKAKPNFGLTGALAKDERTGNIVNGVVLKYSVPLDSAKPNRLWRLYVFKDDKNIETFHLHRQASYLMGRDKRAVDIILEHPSCSSQHAVIQFRKVKVPTNEDEDDDEEREEIKPYLMDLSSTHKTTLNGKQIEDCRYYELRQKDCIKFGGSSREYVLLHATSTENDSD